MLILDIPRRAPHNGGYVDVPIYHRVHLSISQKRTVNVCLLPNLSMRGPLVGPVVPELLVSPFDFEIWDQLWRITATLVDRPGLLHDMAEVLRHHGVRIISSESGTAQQQGVHFLELLVDVADEKQIPFLEWSLGVQFFNDVSFAHNHEAKLKVRRVETLWRAKKLHKQYERLSDSADSLIPFRPVKAKTTLYVSPSGRLRLTLPRAIRQILKEHVSEAVVGQRRSNWGYQVRTSDTKDRFLRVLFIRSSDAVIHARIECSDRGQTLNQVSRVILDGGFNILSAFFSQMDSSRVRLEIVIRASGQESAGTIGIKQKLESQLAQLPEDLAVDVGYPQDYRTAWDSLRIIPQQAHAPLAEPADEFFCRLQDKVKALQAELYTAPSVSKSAFEDRDRRLLMLELGRKYHEVTGVLPTPVLFVSCSYEGDQLEAAQEAAERKGFVVVTGKDLILHPSLREGVVQRMRTCTHFLGVWSTAGYMRLGDEQWPSPWLLWEAGVAEALQLTKRLLIAETITDDAWKRLYPGEQITRFYQDFAKQLEHVLTGLAQLPGRAA